MRISCNRGRDWWKPRARHGSLVQIPVRNSWNRPLEAPDSSELLQYRLLHQLWRCDEVRRRTFSRVKRRLAALTENAVLTLNLCPWSGSLLNRRQTLLFFNKFLQIQITQQSYRLDSGFWAASPSICLGVTILASWVVIAFKVVFRFITDCDQSYYKI